MDRIFKQTMQVYINKILRRKSVIKQDEIDVRVISMRRKSCFSQPPLYSFSMAVLITMKNDCSMQGLCRISQNSKSVPQEDTP